MITSFIITIFSFFIKLVALFLPKWSIWPDVLLNAIHSIASAFASFNFIFPIDQLFSAIQFFIAFEVLMYTSKLIISVVGFFRGTDNIQI